MVFFHGYFSLPEGKMYGIWLSTIICPSWKNHIAWYIYDNIWNMIIRKEYFWNMWISYILNISYDGEAYMEYDYQTYYHKIWFMNILFLNIMDYQKNFVGIWWGDDGDTRMNGTLAEYRPWHFMRLLKRLIDDMTRVINVLSSGWWFQTFFIFNDTWDNPSHWLIFFKMLL